ncbi:MAG: hypothetical protein ACKO91_02460 [Acidimicrobiales bacterium]
MRYGTVDRDYALRLATWPPDEDGPALMVNFLRYRERAAYAHGEALSGREADDRYAPVDVLADLGARIVFTGDVVDSGEVSQGWDRVAIVRYPTRQSFIAMQRRDDFKERHVHKEAGVEFTINCTALPEGPVAGDDGGSGTVTFVLWPEGTVPPAVLEQGARLVVEGRVIGDERRWGHLTVHFGHPAPPAPAGCLTVVVAPARERLRAAIDAWPGR